MFRANDTQQITVYDSFLKQSAHIQRLIEKSWAKDFSGVIFPAIHEERFSVLYSSVGSRPNTPVNVLVGSISPAGGGGECRKPAKMFRLSAGWHGGT